MHSKQKNCRENSFRFKIILLSFFLTLTLNKLMHIYCVISRSMFQQKKMQPQNCEAVEHRIR